MSTEIKQMPTVLTSAATLNNGNKPAPKVEDDLEVVGLEETEEEDEILKALDYVFTTPDDAKDKD